MSERSSSPHVVPGSRLMAGAVRLLDRWPEIGRRVGALLAFEARAVAQSQPPTPWAPLGKPLSEATVAIVSTAGVHLRTDPPFLMGDEVDVSFRAIPASAEPGDLQITHEHYDRTDARRDVNLVFPLPLLRELAAEGVVGRVADAHYSLGFVADPFRLVRETGPEVARLLKGQGADLALLIPA